jgi:hypothetical protein
MAIELGHLVNYCQACHCDYLVHLQLEAVLVDQTGRAAAFLAIVEKTHLLTAVHLL